MDFNRCSKCKKRLIAITDGKGRTELVCLGCDEIDPLKTDAANWANSSLASRRAEALRPADAREFARSL